MSSNEHNHSDHKDCLAHHCSTSKIGDPVKNCKYECMCGSCAKLCVGAFAISIGITNSLLLLVIAWISTFCEWGHSLIQVLGSIYKGYEPSIIGGIWGALEGLIVGVICGTLLACIYNCCLCCCCHFKCQSSSKSKAEKLENTAHHPKDKKRKPKSTN